MITSLVYSINYNLLFVTTLITLSPDKYINLYIQFIIILYIHNIID